MSRFTGAKDSIERYGLVSIFLHWSIALTFMGLFGIGWYMVTLGYYDPWYITLPHWHKSIGMLLIAVVSLRIIWRLFVQKPQALSSHKPWEMIASVVVHGLLGLGVIVVLVSGYLIPTAEGVGVTVFDWFTVPSIISFTDQEDLAGMVHEYAAWFVLVISVLHAGAALKHHFFDRDDTLRRMLPVTIKRGNS